MAGSGGTAEEATKAKAKAAAVATGDVNASTAAVPAMGSAFKTRYDGTASTALKEKSGMVHKAGRIADGQLKTAWCEGIEDDGIGQWVEITSPCSDTQTVTFTGIGMVPGYASKASTFSKNNRVAQAKVTLSVGGAAKYNGTVKFTDAMQEQWAQLGSFDCPAGGKVSARVEIAAVHAGAKYRDTCISELSLYATGNATGAAGSPAPADGEIVRGSTNCKASGWSNDKDRNGLNVRAGTGSEHAVLGALKPAGMKPEFKIVESQDGWLRIKNPYNPEPGGSSKGMPKEGWVSGSMVGLSTRVGDVSLYKRPKTSSEKVAEGMDEASVSRVSACSGGWLKVKATGLTGEKGSGWLAPDDQCVNQFTVCGN